MCSQMNEVLIEMKCELRKFCKIRDLSKSLDKMQCILSQNASVLCEGIECENAVNLSMNCNSIDLNSCKISDKMLSNHNTIHTLNTTTAKQFKCPIDDCDKSYETSAQLTLHKNNTHVILRFTCDGNECGKQFTRLSSLYRHKRSAHLCEKQFKCNRKNCGKSFDLKSTLDQHKRSAHSCEKAFVCHYNDCHKKFTQQARLNVHMNTHKAFGARTDNYSDRGQYFKVSQLAESFEKSYAIVGWSGRWGTECRLEDRVLESRCSHFVSVFDPPDRLGHQ
ncbi:unnamed protein product [Oppiella nova]|uniref:C2H2-type domain-containing protein n=1 Tax=Oppiella nova TaxID=334625 RepID=A0A7R9QT04_9ACAR|nr:unnamed protein product [Oppiella nova]CAG2174365.1 unnamed protein product [Oppiella nova]